MLDDPLPSLLVALGAALVGSLLAGADTALTSLSKTRLSALIEQAEDDDDRKRALERIQREYPKLRSRYLVGRVLCIALTAVFFLHYFDVALPRFSPYAAVVATSLICGGLFETSTTLSRKYADRVAPVATRALRPIEFLLLPLAAPFGLLGAQLARENDGETSADPRVTEAEVEIMVDEVERSGLFGHEPAEMIKNVLDFVELSTRSVMVPRSKIVAVDIETPLIEVRELVAESGHSRYPVFRDEIDNIVGLLYAKDVFKVLNDGGELSGAKIEALVRTSVNFVPETQSLTSLMKDMRSRRQHLFVVVDEFGSLSGIVTLEDVIEEIVGDIQDEHDPAEQAPIRMMEDGSLLANADVSISDLSDYLGADIPMDEEYASIGGMLTYYMGKVPEAGAALSKFGLRFVVRSSDERQVEQVLITRLPAEVA